MTELISRTFSRILRLVVKLSFEVLKYRKFILWQEKERLRL